MKKWYTIIKRLNKYADLVSFLCNWSAVISVFLLLFSAQAQSATCERTYVIGVQGVDYSPHYNFTETNQPNFFGDFVQWLTKKTGCQFSIKALPIKRLKIKYERTHSIDFIYPDNPNWHPQGQAHQQRTFSSPIVVALGGTIVAKENENITLERFRNLTFPRGFTPVAWYPYRTEYQIEFTETSNAISALKMVAANRADGADIEFNVAQHLIKQHNLGSLVLAKNLPFTPTSFYLSTLTEHEVLNMLNEVINENPKAIHELKSALNIVEDLD